MSKASSARARRARARARGGPSKPSSAPVFIIVVAVIVIAGVVAVILSRGGGSSASGPQNRAVTVKGAALPTMTDGGTDAGLGKQLPAITGKTYAGDPISLATGGKPEIIFVVAHWCPHCNNEVPRIVKWMDQGRAPAGIRFVGVSTAVDSSAPHYPPSKWLDDENWKVPTLADSKDSEAAKALGTPGYPYILFVKADGTLAARTSGELAIDDLERMAKELVAGRPVMPPGRSGPSSGAG